MKKPNLVCYSCNHLKSPTYGTYNSHCKTEYQVQVKLSNTCEGFQPRVDYKAHLPEGVLRK